MLTEERHARIFDLVNRKNSITLTDICEELDISESTARRDLKEMAEKGLLTRVHGGALSNRDNFLSIEADVEERLGICREEKRAIGEYAASLVDEGDFVFIDAGTTTEYMIDALTVKDVTFVTNAFVHALRLAKRGYKVLVPEGEVKTTTEAIVGAECVECLSKYNFTKSFIGANGISLKAGITTPDKAEAVVKKTVVENTDRTYILADHTKFDVVTAITFTKQSDVSVITDRVNDKQYFKEGYIKEVM